MDNVWRAEDAYHYNGTARVSPVLKQRYASALQVQGERVVLEGARAKVRTVATYFSGEEDGDAAVSFTVRGTSVLKVGVHGGRACENAHELDSLTDTSHVTVLLTRAGSTLWTLVVQDGRALGEPHPQPCYSFHHHLPESTRVEDGVELVHRYMTGSAATHAGFTPWQGVYVRVHLAKAGTTLCWADAGRAEGVPAALVALQGAVWSEHLLSAAGAGRVEEVERALVKGANPNATDRHGMTPLHWACQEGFARVVQALLRDPRSDSNCLDNEGWPSLFIAMDKGFVDVVQTLLAPRSPALDLVQQAEALQRARIGTGIGREAMVALLEAAIERESPGALAAKHKRRRVLPKAR